MISQTLKLGFLASGNGSSALAIVRATRAGDLAAEARLLVTNTRKAAALDWATELGVPSVCIPTVSDPDAADRELAAQLARHGVEVVVLSGYLRRLGPRTLEIYRGRIINIHPGPLPDFGGEGMYGRRVHEAVLASGRAETAAVIHLVDEEYDHGPQIARCTIPILEGDTPDALEDRVKAAEPGFYIETLQRLAEGRLKLPT